MKKFSLLVAVTLMACTQSPSPETPAEGNQPQASPATQSIEGSTAETPTAATTPVLSLLVGNRVTPAARGNWCLREGTPPFTKISIQDESIAAPIESQSAPVPGNTVAKDTATRQAPGTARITGQRGDSTLTIQWLRGGIKGDAQVVVQGDSLDFTDEGGTATFHRCN